MMGFLTSEKLSRLGIPHAFTTREGGVSTGPYASLNLARGGGGDAPEAAQQNRERVRAALGLTRVAAVKQVHGDVIVDGTPADESVPADGIVVRAYGEGALVTVADCAPVLLARKDGTAVAAVHAGWRGAVTRIAGGAVKKLGTTQVVAAIGPCIGPCCFEVGQEVVDAVLQVAGPEAVRPGPTGKPHVDLAAVVEADLRAAGVALMDIDHVRACTVCDTRFYSHRRDQGVTGRQAGVVGLPVPKE